MNLLAVGDWSDNMEFNVVLLAWGEFIKPKTEVTSVLQELLFARFPHIPCETKSIWIYFLKDVLKISTNKISLVIKLIFLNIDIKNK